ncbi:MAG: myo-inositol-1-phosphate synthase [archaeon GB-1867-005]|nr:myo-inositol-1-phosphate synthase [Candidatus Culexmicrobium cathedralense]
MINAILLGQGMVATHLAVGLERIKSGEIEPYGVPLAKYELPYKIEDINLICSYDVDAGKVERSIYEVAKKLIGEQVPIPQSLKDVHVREGVHLGSLKGLIEKTVGLESKMTLKDACDKLADEWKELNVDVIVNVITTEHGEPFNELAKLEKAIEENQRDKLTASHFYAYTAAKYSEKAGKPIAFINVIPTPLANDPAIVKLYAKSNSIVLGDDGATGATPLTADLLEHMAERNRRVKFIVQFNIGGNLDFLALTVPEKNIMKEKTKSSIVKDILGYDTPHYIKPTGYLKPLGDKKYVALHLEYLTFNGLTDELYVNVRLNDSPALAGKLVDLIRLSKVALDKGYNGTIYEINSFFMKKPGPVHAKSVSKIVAFHNMIKWLKELDAIQS